MDEQEKKTEEVTGEKTAETPTEEKKTEAKESKKAKKAEKPSFAKRAKSAVVRNKKPIIAGAAGFVSGVAAAIGGSMWLGHRHRKAAEAAMRENPVIPDETYSPLDPNIE